MQRPHILVPAKRNTSRLQLIEPSRQNRPPRQYQTREEAEVKLYHHYQATGYPDPGHRIPAETEHYEMVDPSKEISNEVVGLSSKVQDNLNLNPGTDGR